MRQEKSNAHRRGAAMVEMAIVLILLLMVVLGAIEYGWLFLTMQRMTNAARHGARVAAAFGATVGEGQSEMQDLLALSRVPWKTAEVGPSEPNTVTARIAVDTTERGVRLVNWDMLPVPETLQVTVTMAKEGGNP